MPALPPEGLAPALKSLSFALATPLVLQRRAFALERKELLLEKWLARPLPVQSLALKAVALSTLVRTPQEALVLKSLALTMPQPCSRVAPRPRPWPWPRRRGRSRTTSSRRSSLCRTAW